MYPILRHSFIKYRGQILGWGIGLALLGGFLLTFYDTLADQQDSLAAMFEAYPPEVFAFFGDMSNLFTPGGYLHTEFYSYMPIILGFFSILAGASLLAGDEESGVLDLLMAHPVSRTSTFLGRLLAYVAATFAIFAITWLGFVIAEPATQLNLSPVELALPLLSMFSVLLLFGSLAILLSMVLPSVRLAATVSVMLLIGSFFLSSLATISEDLEQAAHLSPLNYYQGGEAVTGLNWEWFAVLIGISVVILLGALLVFNRKDIRVGGEGSLGIGGFWKKKERSLAAVAQ